MDVSGQKYAMVHPRTPSMCMLRARLIGMCSRARACLTVGRAPLALVHKEPFLPLSLSASLFSFSLTHSPSHSLSHDRSTFTRRVVVASTKYIR